MNLVIDIGNTHIKMAVFSQGSLTKTSIIGRSELAEALTKNWEGIIVSNVGKLPELDFSKALVLSAATKLPLKLAYKTPHTLGVDRIAAVVGAQVLFPQSTCLVIDMGTCVTYDLITEEQVYEGGIISPGWQMRLQAMNNFTASLPLLTKTEKTPHTGKATDECMQSGAFHGLLYEIEGFVAHYRQVYPHLKVLLCGGDSKTFETKLKQPIFVQPNLVLIGLNRILEYHNAE